MDNQMSGQQVRLSCCIYHFSTQMEATYQVEGYSFLVAAETRSNNPTSLVHFLHMAAKNDLEIHLYRETNMHVSYQIL